MTDEADLGSVTSLLKRADPAWWWIRENFKLPSVLTIAGMLVSGGAWLWTQHSNVRDLEKRVVAIKDPTPRFDRLEARTQALELDAAAAKQRAEDFSRRVADQEDEWKIVHQAAAQLVPRGRPAR
jgi:hypothetical protein